MLFPDQKQMQETMVKANNLMADITGIRESLTAHTTLLEKLNDRMGVVEDPKPKPLPQFLDLTMASPRISTDSALNVVAGWISSAGAVELVLHIGEAGVFYHMWIPAGGIMQNLPLVVEYPLMIPRGTPVWIETVGQQAQDFHCKLVAYRS